MKRGWRLIWGLAVITIALLVAACTGKTSGPSVIGETPATAGRVFNIVYVQGVTGNPFFTSLTCGAQAEAQALGNVNFTFQGGRDYSAQAQTPVLNAVIARRPDAIIISPMAGQAMVAPLTQAREAGITLVFADTTAADATLAVSFIGSDNIEGGQFAADNLARLLGGQGKVLIESALPGISTADQRVQGFQQEIQKYPGIRSIGVQYSQGNPSQATAQVSAALSAHPDLAGIFAISTQEVEGAAIALTNAGKQGTVKLLGFDTSPPILEHVAKGAVQGLVVQEPEKMGRLAMQQAVNAMTGRPVIPVINTHFVFLTRDNMRDPDVAKFIYRTSCQ